MQIHMQKIRMQTFFLLFLYRFRYLPICAVLLIVVRNECSASILSHDEIRTTDHAEWSQYKLDGYFSKEWFDAVRQALPASYLKQGNLDFHWATNGLALESKKGNVAAQALWGFSLIILKSSPQNVETGVDLLRNAAKKGNMPAMLNLGYLLEAGKYVHTNQTEAFQLFTQAAKLNSADAQLSLGKCYHYGLGTTADLPTALRYYQRAAEQTNYIAMKSLGFMLMDGLGVKKNEEQAKYWLLRAAKEGGNARAMYNLAVLCTRKRDQTLMGEAFDWLQQSAKLGDPLAAQELSYFYLRGWGGVKTNLTTYREWQFKAALFGATDAQYFVGAAFRGGDGVPQSRENALLWYRKAAAKNHPDALYDLALLYLEEKTNSASLKLANEYMLRAAQMGHREAQLQCAMSYFRGDISHDCDQGAKWLAQAAENGWPRAEFTLFQLYFSGVAAAKDCPAYPKDLHEGIKWLRRAAEHGSMEAQSTFAVMLIKGQLVKQNKVEAEKLLRSAAERGHVEAQNDLGFAILNKDIDSTDPTEAAFWCSLSLSHATGSKMMRAASMNLLNALSGLSPTQKDEVDKRVKEFHQVPIVELDPKVRSQELPPDYPMQDD